MVDNDGGIMSVPDSAMSIDNLLDIPMMSEPCDWDLPSLSQRMVGTML
jgi:hypothetical protein